MVTVYPLEHFDAHAEKPFSRPKADAILHHPGRRGMTQSMRRRWRLKAGQFDGALKGGFHQLNRLALNNTGWNSVRIRLELLWKRCPDVIGIRAFKGKARAGFQGVANF
jgi:hypothetical protein